MSRYSVPGSPRHAAQSEVTGSRYAKNCAVSGRLATDLHRRADRRGQSPDVAGDDGDWIFLPGFPGHTEQRVPGLSAARSSPAVQWSLDM